MSALDHLADQERWVGWRNEPRGNKLTKIPYGRAGKARADDPATWVTRAEAEAIARRIVNGRGAGSASSSATSEAISTSPASIWIRASPKANSPRGPPQSCSSPTAMQRSAPRAAG